MGRDLAIDLGTKNTIAFAEGRGVVLAEPTVVAVERERGKMVAAGWDALREIDAAPDELEAVWPVRNGAVADFVIAEWILSRFVRKLRRRVYGRFLRFPVRPRALLCVPAGATDLEFSTTKRVVLAAGVRSVQTIEVPLAAAVGAGLEVEEVEGSMIVDIGCGKMEAAVLCLGSIVAGCSARTGSGAMDAAIRSYLRKSRNLSVDLQEAERLKIELGSALPLSEPEFAEVSGVDALTGSPKTTMINSTEIHAVIEACVDTFVEVIRRALENSSAELVSDIAERGLVLAGGGAQLRLLEDLLHYKLGVPVVMAQQPLECAAVGAGMLLDRAENRSDRVEQASKAEASW